jgi:hypothetical protein
MEIEPEKYSLRKRFFILLACTALSWAAIGVIVWVAAQ